MRWQIPQALAANDRFRLSAGVCAWLRLPSEQTYGCLTKWLSSIPREVYFLCT